MPGLVSQLVFHTPNPTVNCETDGSEGKRILAVYLYPNGQSDDYAKHVDDIDRTLSKIDDVWNAAADPYDQHPRWECNPNDALPVVVQLQGPAVPTDGSYTFAEVQIALNQQGLTAPDRVYLVFADHIGSYPLPGQATVDADDRPDQTNLNNTGPAYAMVDAETAGWTWAGMWSPGMHELGHALGAVQCTAPHSSCAPGETGFNHCYDQSDVMCYNDGGSYYRGPDGVAGTSDDGTVQNVCASNSSDAAQWDCNKDDYFNPSPEPGSYLATHWNLANSAFVSPLRVK